MSVTTRTPPPTRRRKQVDVSHKKYDLIGISLIALAVVTVLSLVLADTGLIGSAISQSIEVLFGKGSWAVPFVLAAMGVGIIAGKRSVEATHLVLGLSLLFVAILGGCAREVDGNWFDVSTVSGSGGFLGAVVGWLFDTLLKQAKPIGLGFCGMAGVLLIVQTPLKSLFENAAQKVISGRTRGKRVSSLRQRAEKPERGIAAVRLEERENASQEREDPRRTRQAPLIRDTVELNTGSADTVPKEGYQLPPTSLLSEAASKPKRSAQEMEENIETLESTLEEFGIDANVVEVAAGPTVTRYEIQLGPGIRVARITALADNIAMNLSASHVRVEAPIPGKPAIGVEVPNATPSPVTLREVVESKEFRDNKSPLWVALGQDVSGQNKYADLTRMPHLLIGGATNSGKSVGLTAIIMSLLMRNTPKDLKFVMIDPKRVELAFFDNIPHLLCPVIKDIKEAPGVLRAVWREMDRRYDVFSEHGVRNIEGWNEKASFQDRMPYVVVIIDELADLMMQSAAEVETSICRLAQLARATGIHLVIATQRPSVDVITGTIKANVSSRIAFTVSSQIDSRTILDQKGAEDLIGRGDMLFMPIDASKPVRIQGCYVSEKEIGAVCKFWRDQEKPAYVLTPVDMVSDKDTGVGGASGDEENDPLWEQSVRWVVDRGQASTSMLQRRFSIGFQRASRLLDVMEERGIVGPRDGPRPREVLIDPMDVDTLFGGRPYGDAARVRPELDESDW